MKFAFFGSSLVSAYWNGAATYYRGIIRALAERGHEITFYEPDAYDRQKHRDMPDPEWARVVVWDTDGHDDVQQKLREARSEADVLVKCSGVGVMDEFLEAAVIEMRPSNGVVLFWDVDAPATLDRMEDNPDDRFRGLVEHYDAVFTYGGGEPVIDAYRRFGAARCVPIYNALDPETHHPVEPNSEFDASLNFLGNRLPDREERVEEFFLEPASRLPDQRFILGGSGWDDKPMPSNVDYVGHVYTRDHNAFNCSANAVLNISRESMARYGFSPATRVFEAAGAGACLISDAWEGIELFLQPGEEVLLAHDADDVVRLMSDLDPKQARDIGEAARERVLAEHTYQHRALEIEEVLNTHLSRVGERR